MTELIWNGKYDANGNKIKPVRLALPFQDVETVNESAQQRQMMLDMWGGARDNEWRNRLIWGDKKYVLPSLLPEFAGKVDLIYIDPPFATGADFSYIASVPDDPTTDGNQSASFVKQPSMIEQKAYRDTWGCGLDSYLQWFYEAAVLLHELLAEDGAIYVHCDPRLDSALRLLLDEVFGPEGFRNEVIWKRTTSHSDASAYGVVHDTILFYAKPAHRKNGVTQAYDAEYTEQYYRYLEPSGRRFMSADLTGAGGGPARRFGERGFIEPPAGRHWMYDQDGIDRLVDQDKIFWTKNGIPRFKKYLDESPGMPASDVWTDIQALRSWHKDEQVGYPTQKPEALLERIIQASSNEGDLVLDCFAGSGTTAAVAEKLSRRWITSDLGRFAIHTTRKRLLSIPDVKPFVVQNLGKYERQAWQVAEFGENKEKAALAQARYRDFILKLYGAQPLSGYTWLHGTKSGRMVHVGSVDAPVLLGDVRAIAQEFWKAREGGKNAVDVLGWDFAFELNEMGKQMAAEANIDMAFKRIPREVLERKAVEQGDIRFYELAALDVALTPSDGCRLAVELCDFIVNPDDVPEEVQRSITHWSQYVDYWAVDWDFRGDTFHNQWQSYRTRKNPKLETTATHTYEEPGEKTVLIKVIDLLGNDTTKAVKVEVR